MVSHFIYQSIEAFVICLTAGELQVWEDGVKLKVDWALGNVPLITNSEREQE